MLNILLTISVEIVVTVGPRENLLEGGKHVVQSPGYDHVVIDAANERDH